MKKKKIYIYIYGLEVMLGYISVIFDDNDDVDVDVYVTVFFDVSKCSLVGVH
jgi:hypothetical protein